VSDILAARLDHITRQGLYRELVNYEPVDATHVSCGDRTFLLLASNNYLGLTHHPAVRQAAAIATNHGTGSGGSRLTTGNHLYYSSLERELAEFKGCEAALVFNTGYMANVGAISSLAGPDDIIFSDALNHASIVDGCRLARAHTVIYRHNDIADLTAKLAVTPCKGLRLIVTDGVFSMDGDIAPLDEIVLLAEHYGAMVMVDDAHATGVIGPGGHGTVAHFGLQGRVQIQMGTLSKSLAAEGGYIAGSRILVDYLVNTARAFIFSTALAPATVAAARAALGELAANPGLVTRLQENTAFLRQALAEAGLAVGGGVTPILAVLVGEAGTATEFAQELRAAGLIVSAIRPPTVPAGTSRLRITVSAAHTREELAWAAGRIGEVVCRLGITGEG